MIILPRYATTSLGSLHISVIINEERVRHSAPQNSSSQLYIICINPNSNPNPNPNKITMWRFVEGLKVRFRPLMLFRERSILPVSNVHCCILLCSPMWRMRQWNMQRQFIRSLEYLIAEWFTQHIKLLLSASTWYVLKTASSHNKTVNVLSTDTLQCA